MKACFRSIVLGVLVASALGAAEKARLLVKESARDIPVAHQVDVVVVGGGTGAVAAAVAAAEKGAKVFLAAPRPVSYTHLRAHET